MTKREEFGLTFEKKVVEGNVHFSCKRHGIVNDLNYLQFLTFLTIGETDDLIDEINLAQTGGNYNENPTSDGYAHYHLRISDTIFKVGNYPGGPSISVSLEDIKQLLMEWKEFIES
jgi:hypothetical protein